MEMKITLIVAALCALVCLATGSQAEGLYFAQDDFLLIYGQPNAPGSAGAQFTADGRLVNWDQNIIAAWYTISGSNSSGAYLVGNEYKTDYDTRTILTITTMPNGAGSVLWQGTGSAYTLVHTDQSPYDATSFDRPDWYNTTIISSGFVSEYQSVGAGSFTKTAGPWEYSEFNVDWFGSYDWNFCYDGQENEIGVTGNMQGQLSQVPEPGSMVAYLTGVVAMLGTIKRRKF